MGKQKPHIRAKLIIAIPNATIAQQMYAIVESRMGNHHVKMTSFVVLYTLERALATVMESS